MGEDPRMAGRHGTTLMEVLVSIFVMSIGLIALLTLFPLGAFEMADALRDGRVSACVANATALASAWNLRHDPTVTSVRRCFDCPDSTNYFVDVSTVDPTSNIPWMLGPSYPVYVDPIGCTNYLSAYYKQYVAGLAPQSPLTAAGQAGIPRVATSYAQPGGLPGSLANARPWFIFLDDITFASNGTADKSSGSVQHAYNFSWAYLLRRPKNSVPSIVEMWVIVYQQRPLGPNSGGDENFYPGTVTSPKAVRLGWHQPGAKSAPVPIAVRPGNWILDCSAAPDVTTGKSKPGNARFYRVVGVSENEGSTDLEVDSPIVGPPMPGVLWLPGDSWLVPPTRFVVMDNVVEVVYKGTNWQP